MIKLQKYKLPIFTVIITIIVLFDFVLVKSQLFQENMNLLTVGISLDFVIVIPLLFYFINHRRLRKNLSFVAPLALLGYLILLLILPNSAHNSLQPIQYTIIAIELAFFCYGSYKLASIVRQYKLIRKQSIAPITALRASITKVLSSGRWTAMLVHDLSIFYYAFLSWRKKRFNTPYSAAFSYHKESNYLIIVLFICKLLILEGILFHILLAQWSHLAAIILSTGNIYVILLLIADFRAICLNPIVISEQKISIQYGLQLSCEIQMSEIQSVSSIQFNPLTKEQLKTAVTPLATEPNLLITLSKPIVVTMLFGKQKSVERIYLFLDHPQQFSTYCQQFINNDA